MWRKVSLHNESWQNLGWNLFKMNWTNTFVALLQNALTKGETFHPSYSICLCSLTHLPPVHLFKFYTPALAKPLIPLGISEQIQMGVQLRHIDLGIYRMHEKTYLVVELFFQKNLKMNCCNLVKISA